MKRQDVIRAAVVVCVTLVALGVLVPARSPAVTPMGIVVTTWKTTVIAPTQVGPQNFTLVFTFSNITTMVVATSYYTTSTLIYWTQVIYTMSVTTSSTVSTTVTTHTVTKTSGTTTVPSTSTTWTTVTGTTTGQTVTATSTQTLTNYATTSSTTTSIYTVTGATEPSPPPIPGFPLESILAGLGLGLLGVHLVFRNRRANKKRSI